MSGDKQGTRRKKLIKGELKAFQEACPRWTYTGDALRRTVKFRTYIEGIDFVQKVAELAEETNHHPNMVVSWREVEVILTSHDVGGITGRDKELAQRIEELIRLFS